MESTVVVNGRYLSHRITGVQRYAQEVQERLHSCTELVSPTKPLKGLAGHIWEQFVLPSKSRRRVLWSPCNTGPIVVHNQVLTVHDLVTLDHPEWFSHCFAALYRSLLPTLAQRVRRLIAVSSFTKRRLVELFGVPEEKVTVIPNGVAREFFPRSAGEVAAVRRSLGIPAGRYVLSVCSLEPRKNLSRLLSAWAEVQKTVADVTLVVAGAKGVSSIYRAHGFPASAERVTFPGYIPEEHLPALYSGASCFVYPSLYEGFGLPILEAAACGVPVVTSNCTSIPEIAGPSAILVDPFSVAEISSAIRGLLENPERLPELTAHGRAHVEQYTWERCALTTERLLLSLC